MIFWKLYDVQMSYGVKAAISTARELNDNIDLDNEEKTSFQ